MRQDPYTRLRKRIEMYIKKHPLPPKKENINKFKKLRLMETLLCSNPTLKKSYKLLRDDIIISNGGFGMKYAIKYCKKINNNTIIDDVFQQAQVGIIEAVDRFNPDLGWNFPTFAYHYVLKNIIDLIKENKLVKAPREMARNIKNVVDASAELITELEGNIPTAEEIKVRVMKNKCVDLTVDMIESIMQLIDLNSGASDETFVISITEDIVSQEETQECMTIMKTMITNELAHMNKELVDTIKMRFGIEYDRPYSIPEIRLLKDLDEEAIEKHKDTTRIYLNY